MDLAENTAEALARLSECEYGLLFLDLHLPDGDGLALAEEVSRLQPGAYRCLMSGPDSLQARAAEFERAKLAHIFVKPLDRHEIAAVMARLAHQKADSSELSDSTTWLPLSTDDQMDFLAHGLAALSPAGRLEASLQQLCEFTRAEAALLFVRDPASRAISIVAQAGHLPLNLAALVGLGDSPVKDVILEQQTVNRRQITGQVEAAFRNLSALTGFESCIGVPVQTLGEVRHALFLLHRQPRAFSAYRLRDALAGAVLLGTLLEMRSYDERLVASEATLLSGQLATAFAHEMYNKVSGLDFLIDDLISAGGDVPGLRRVSTLVRDIRGVVAAFQAIHRGHSRQEPVDVNEVLNQAGLLLGPLARKDKVSIAYHLAETLPPVSASRAWLQQIFYNLGLNAIQQLAGSPGRRRLLEIKSGWQPDATRPVSIRFSDTGPGIHRQNWNRIFDFGFTTRTDGTGLGLYLVRSLLNRMGGSIHVEESLVPIGTTFLLELPAA